MENNPSNGLGTQDQPLIPASSPAIAPNSGVSLLPRALPTSLLVGGVALFLAFLFDLVPLWPPQFQSITWQIALLERIFNQVSIAMLGVLAILCSIWIGDTITGIKSRLTSGVVGVLSVVMGVCLLLAIPLYSQNINRLFQLKKIEIANQRQLDAPAPGSELAEKYDGALKDLRENLAKSAFRFNANAGVMGFALFVLGAMGVRYTRKRPDVGFSCPTCQSTQVRLSQMDATEKSLALVTRLHTFRCQDCGWRFRRFSLTGKPFPFFF